MSLQKRDIWKEDAEPLLLEQYKGAERFKAVIKASCDYLSQIEAAAFEVGDVFNIGDGEYTGAKLDYIGGLFGIPRNTGETDKDYRDRLRGSIKSKDAGTAEYLMRNAKNMSGDPAPQFLDEAPATFFVYTPDGSQLTRAQVQKLAPAGVLGLPGAAIELADGSLLHLAGRPEVRIICAAQDVIEGAEPFLTDEDGNNLTTEQGEILTTEST